MGNRIVCKFGGTSLADANRIRKVFEIVKSIPERMFIVVSAPGKRYDSDQKITDLLLICQSLALQKLSYQEPLEIVKQRYLQIAEDLEVRFVEEQFLELENQLIRLSNGQSNIATSDWIASRGEFFNAILIARFFGAIFVDSSECIRFTEDNSLDPISYKYCAKVLEEDHRYYRFVIPGFYGSNAQGLIKTFPRGGSDITGAVVARAINAKLYENWTDVSGFLMADPKVVENPRQIKEMTYRELRELAYMGANVLHEETIFPVVEVGIPIQIKNTNLPEDLGTSIVRDRDSKNGMVIGVAGRVGFTAVYIEKPLMNLQIGFGRRVLEVFESNGISWEHMPSAIDSISVIVSDEQFAAHKASVVNELRRVLEPERLELYENLALITTVGEGMAYQTGVSGRLFQALGQAGVNVRMISQGASEISIVVGVSSTDYKTAVQAIYHEFVKSNV